jgi:hypothetical protein
VTTNVRGSEQKCQDSEEVGDRRSDAPMDVEMDRATTVCPLGAETLWATIFDPME